MARVGVTGAAGFVGSNLCLRLKKQGYTVVGLDSMIRKGSQINAAELRTADIDFYSGEICRNTDVSLLSDCHVIIHCAAQPSAVAGLKNSLTDFEVNVGGTVNLLELCKRRNIGMIFFSSNKAYTEAELTDKNRHFYGNRSIYGASKLAAEVMAFEYQSAFHIPIIVNRFSCLAGERQWGKAEQGWAAWLVYAAMFDLPVQIFGWNGLQIRDVLHVSDLADLIVKQVNYMLDSRMGIEFPYDVGGGVNNHIAFIDAVKLVGEMVGKPIKTEYIDKPRYADHKTYISNIENVSDAFHWSPKVGVKETFQRIYGWAKENEDKLREIYCKDTQ